MTLDGLCGLNNGFQATVGGPEIPALQESFPRLSVGLFKEFLKGQADLIRSGCLQVVVRQGVHLSTLLTGQIVGVLEPQVARFLQHVCGFGLLPPDFVHRLVHDLHNMKSIKGDLRIGKGRIHAFYICGPHITADLLDLIGVAPVGTQVDCEGTDGVLIAPFRPVQETFYVQIEEETDVVMSPATGRFIHADTAHFREIGLPAGFFDMMVEHAPDACIVLANYGCNDRHRHLASHDHDQSFEQRREAAAGACPGHFHGLDTASLGTLNSWNPGM